ncbi:MAG: L,D-transpeptidase family protein [Thermodesulfovibrionales bacterium]
MNFRPLLEYYQYMRRIYFIFIFIAICGFFSPSDAFQIYSYADKNTVIGSVKTHKIKGDESLIEVARRFGIGYNSIVDANPGVDPFIPGSGISITIPTSWILPDMASYDGIIINLSEMRLYLFSKHSAPIVRTYPIGIGSEGNETPVGVFKITEKVVKPSWYVPESIRKEKPELPRVVPPGPNNPLGSHALRLSAKSVLIHGTNRPFAVGRRASHGCIRMYPEDIPKLFLAVPNRSKVTIIRQPVKVGVSNSRVFIEIHKDEILQMNYFNEAIQLLRKKDLYDSIDKEKMLSALREKKGIPVDITK